MRRELVLSLLVGCGEDPSLRVEVTHPDEASEAIARTTLTVYESPIVSCDKIEFGDLSASELTATERDQITIGEGELAMSREGTKVIVARGLSDKDALITAGCAEQGVVGEGDVLAISTELAASVSVNGIGLDDLDPFGIVVTVTDPFVRSLPERVVSWRVFGSSGTEPLISTGVEVTGSEWVPASPACTNDNGLIRLHPTPPSTIGGFATAVRTSWSVEPPRVFSTFTPINGMGALTKPPVRDVATFSQRRCALRVAGAVRRLVCLEDRGVPTAVDYKVQIVGGGAAMTEQATQTFTLGADDGTPLNVFSIARGAATDVYAMTTRGRIVGLFSPSVAPDTSFRLAAPFAITDVALLPACGATAAALLVRVEGIGKDLRTLAITGTGFGASLVPYVSPGVGVTDTLAINATGCVAELTSGGAPILHQVGVVDITDRDGANSRNATVAYCEANACEVRFAVARAGVGFLPADDTHPERMVGATFDASGTILSVTALQRDNAGNLRPVEQERITAASFPQRVVTGQFDGDGLADLFWDILNPLSATTNFQLSYAHPVLGERLSALSATLGDTVVVDTFVADTDGDGHDDLVIASQDTLRDPSKHRVLVLPGQVPIPSVTLQQDPACASR